MVSAFEKSVLMAFSMNRGLVLVGLLVLPASVAARKKRVLLTDVQTLTLTNGACGACIYRRYMYIIDSLSSRHLYLYYFLHLHRPIGANRIILATRVCGFKRESNIAVYIYTTLLFPLLYF